MSSNLTMIVVLVTVIHVAALVVMIWIRVRPCEADGPTGESRNVAPCAVCGEPSTHRRYDGLDPNEKRDPRTGLIWSDDITRYRPLCGTH